ncbi:hypothetical protein K466DRAFT_543778 [Polyporus arcularius HHB13444]|uniref:DUF4470 domain-containing protein n=1 Tax=Polyporus arcularius HHB13444 TaxID=1314778 RepID=A0A5C3PMM9_9APHY|nr:hypothetical protein K466DRAFT_543778 [Polyporus arcularius HHB13444]
MRGNAAILKEQGNVAFKAGQLTKASELYQRAEQADPKDHVYPSNLSAALYELGDYKGSVDAVCRSWSLLQDCRDAKADLVLRLSTRLAKALCHGVRAGTITRKIIDAYETAISQLRHAATERLAKVTNVPAIDDLTRSWEEWDVTQAEYNEGSQNADDCLNRWARLPLFCKPLDHTKEFFPIGTDAVIDLTEGWDFQSSYPLHVNKLPLDRLSQIAFLFGGVGDGRHVFGTICGLHNTYKKLSKAKQAHFRSHITMLDVHDGMIARDLCILMLLHEYNTAASEKARVAISATLMYTYLGAAMPSYCYDKLQGVIKDLQKRLAATPPDLPPWLHVVADTIPAVTRILEYWTKTVKSTHEILAAYNHTGLMDRPDPSDVMSSPGINPELKQALEAGRMAKRESIRNMILGMSDADLVRRGMLPANASPAAARAFLERDMDGIVDAMERMMAGNRVPAFEEDWFRHTKVFLPPQELFKAHPAFVQGRKEIKEGAQMSKAAETKAINHIISDWKPNITLFDLSHADPRFYPDLDGYPTLDLDIFDTVNQLGEFVRRDQPEDLRLRPRGRDALAWQTCDAFFREVAAALKTLGSRIRIELICGGLSEELAKMRFNGDLTRPKEFPRKYTRMWLSNVPDYTHGPMNMSIYVAPNLQDHSQAAVACNCLLNTGAWANDAEFFHTYTFLLPGEFPRYLACPVIDEHAIMGNLVLGVKSLPRPLSELATRDELITWLARVLFNTFIHGHSLPAPTNVRLPHNLVAFFGLLMHLHRVGYPGHWLSDFMSRVLSGQLLSDVPPYDDVYPIAVSHRNRRVQPRRVRTDPWLVDFENIIATAYHAIPFPIAGALPADFSRSPDDIVVWEAHVQEAEFASHRFANFTGHSPHDPRTHLLFYRSDVATADRITGDVRRIFEGKPTPAPGTFFILTAQEYVQYETCIRFRLSKTRYEKMKQEKWSTVAYRNDTGDVGK